MATRFSSGGVPGRMFFNECLFRGGLFDFWPDAYSIGCVSKAAPDFLRCLTRVGSATAGIATCFIQFATPRNSFCSGCNVFRSDAPHLPSQNIARVTKSAVLFCSGHTVSATLGLQLEQNGL